MIELKKYQKQTLDEFGSYLDRIRQYSNDNDDAPHKLAFMSQTNSPYHSHELDVPYVCIKIPTGGGKTFVACHAMELLYRKYLRFNNNTGLVMWLVPTDAILEQTIIALKNRRHPYRQALDHAFINVIIMDSDEALFIKTSDLANNLCIVVATFATFRIEDKDQRRVYRENGSLMGHFTNVDIEGLDAHGGVVTPSLGNVIKLYRPIVVLDEGHNTKTNLSYDMIREFRPSFVMEYTATPRQGIGKETNVLVNIGALELKTENMVKIPIVHTNVTDWKRAIDDGMAKRNILEKASKNEKKHTGEYIRPIALIQAERDAENEDMIHVDQIREYLLSKGISEREISIKTGTRDELKNKNLYSNTSPIRYIITVKALAEGWDNSFAYVLISVANIGSKVAAEQLIGRVLRMPNQKRKKNEELNRSYAYTSSSRFLDTTKQLEKGLVDNGYSKHDLIAPDTEPMNEKQSRLKINDNNIKLPCIALRTDINHLIDFDSDLISSVFTLGDKEIPKSYDLENIEGRAVIDVDKGGHLGHREVQTMISDSFRKKDQIITKDDLINKLDRKLHRSRYLQSDIRTYLSRAIDGSNKNIDELSKDLNTVIEILDSKIDELENNHAKETFDRLYEEGKLYCKFYDLPHKIIVKNPLHQSYQRHLFEDVGEMNDEEINLAERIDALVGIKWWYRNPVREDGSFYIQGWRRNKVYPDWIIKTESNKYMIAEYKGEHLADSDDTQYKNDLGRMLSKLAGNNYAFRMIRKKDVNVFINELKNM